MERISLFAAKLRFAAATLYHGSSVEMCPLCSVETFPIIFRRSLSCLGDRGRLDRSVRRLAEPIFAIV